MYRWASLTDDADFVLQEVMNDLAGPGIAVLPRIHSYDAMLHMKWLAPVSSNPSPYIRVQAGLFGQKYSVELKDIDSGSTSKASDSESAFGYAVGLESISRFSGEPPRRALWRWRRGNEVEPRPETAAGWRWRGRA